MAIDGLRGATDRDQFLNMPQLLADSDVTDIQEDSRASGMHSINLARVESLNG